jgi:hypothetical protein
MDDADDADDGLASFRLVRFSPRRADRGAPAALIECADRDNACELWMSLGDVLQNISEWGPEPGLVDAREAYRNWRPAAAG